MVIANAPAGHADLPIASEVTYRTGEPVKDQFMVVDRWEKSQELRSGKVTLWDHCFELPHKHLEAEQTIQESATVGKITHKLKVANNDKLEIYDFPGQYAQRFDGVDKGGGDKAADLQKIFQDNKRTAGIRMQEEAFGGLWVRGAGNCVQWSAGYKFTLERHFNANGAY